jgi:hypothetical protein
VQITLEEWCEYWAWFISESHKAPPACRGWPLEISWVREYMHFWFDLMDTTGDGDIDEDEYVAVLGYYEINADEAKYCYRKIVADGRVVSWPAMATCTSCR